MIYLWLLLIVPWLFFGYLGAKAFKKDIGRYSKDWTWSYELVARLFMAFGLIIFLVSLMVNPPNFIKKNLSKSWF